MKPLVTSVNAVLELATGLSPSAIPTSSVLYRYQTDSADYLVASQDKVDTQRMVLMRTDNLTDEFVPDELVEWRRDVLSRMASFAERAKTRPVSLPRGWHQYKYDNLVAFFAVPGGRSQSARWIAEVVSNERADVIFRRFTTEDNFQRLDEIDTVPHPVFDGLDSAWHEAIRSAQTYFADVAGEASGSPDVEILLPRVPQPTSTAWTYEQWLTEVSTDQRAFIEAPATRSIRLRGPAGSGKTAAITLKAVTEILRAREVGEQIRVLVVTHSWALASQIQESVDRLGLGPMSELDVFPLLEIAQDIAPGYNANTAGQTLIGEDSYSGKQAQLDEIRDIIDEFISGDWVTYRKNVSAELQRRFDSPNKDDRKALAWDLLEEFGSVIGAASIFPGAGAESRYLQLQRSAWMLPLRTMADLRLVFRLYCLYVGSIQARSLTTSDMVLADFLKNLDTFAWNHARKSHGFDLVFVDEFHLFNKLERQVLQYLIRDVSSYPRVFMAFDPRQSASEAIIGAAADSTSSSNSATGVDLLSNADNFELTTIHRFTPQILQLIKHIHLEFPTLDLGKDWDIDYTMVESAQEDGPIPTLISSASQEGEETEVYRTVTQLYARSRIALAVVDPRQWRRFSELASAINRSAKYHVTLISGRADIERLGYRGRGLIVGPAEYLAGLQFEVVLVAGIPDLGTTIAPNERIRLLSLLYLAISRAEKQTHIFINDDDGGMPDVLKRALANGLLQKRQGSLT